MSKVLVIPDLHLKLDVLEKGIKLADKLRADNIVLLGDYLDDYTFTNNQYREMINRIKNLVRFDHRVVALLGNHELSYLGFPCSGYNNSLAEYIKAQFAHDHRFYFAVGIDGVLYSHAGVCTSWLKDNNIITQNVFRNQLTRQNGAHVLEREIGKVSNFAPFAQAGPARGGKLNPSPLWADITELIADAVPKVRQVVGHTPITQIEKIGTCWFTDVFSNGNVSDEYLFVVDGEPEIKHYNLEFKDE